MLNLIASPDEMYDLYASQASDPVGREITMNERNVSPSAAGKLDAAPASIEIAQNQTATIEPGGLERLAELGLLSAALVDKAESGSSPAHDFRLQARMYRELLRQAMLGDRDLPQQEQLPQELLLEMVRMSALLHSAADCKTGFVITCPADLMLQLKAQQARVDQGLKMARMMRE